MEILPKIELKEGQQIALIKIKDFLSSPEKRIFILKGYAGTGKTTLLKEVVKYLEKNNSFKYSLLASTGRAAKIMSNITSSATQTVHSQIYKFINLNQDIQQIVDSRDNDNRKETGQLFLNFDLNPVDEADHNNNHNKLKRVYIVDEASMINDKADENITQAKFGSGKLLTDLLNYDKNSKIIFVGDECQLPPVGQDFSPALNKQYIERTFKLDVEEYALREIVRQNDDNGIIMASKRIRYLYENPPEVKAARFPLRKHQNIVFYANQVELITAYTNKIKSDGYNEATFIAYSNSMCDKITNIIRPIMGISHTMLQRRDLLLITQNNHNSGLMNGDLVEVVRVENTEIRAGLTFRNVTLRELFSGRTNNQLLIEEILYNNQINLNQIQQKELFIDYYLRMQTLGVRQEDSFFRENMLKDVYLNAIRAVFGYCLTCQKCQGGEWNDVYLDIPKSLPYVQKPYVYQWIYTAVTRAKCRVHVVDEYWLV